MRTVLSLPLGVFFFFLMFFWKRGRRAWSFFLVWICWMCVLWFLFPAKKKRQLVRGPVQTTAEVENTTGRKVKDLFCSIWYFVLFVFLCIVCVRVCVCVCNASPPIIRPRSLAPLSPLWLGGIWLKFANVHALFFFFFNCKWKKKNRPSAPKLFYKKNWKKNIFFLF